GPAVTAGGLPGRRVPRRRRGIPLQGDRPDDGHAHRHGDVPPAPGPQAAPRGAGRPPAVAPPRGRRPRRAHPGRLTPAGRPAAPPRRGPRRNEPDPAAAPWLRDRPFPARSVITALR